MCFLIIIKWKFLIFFQHILSFFLQPFVFQRFRNLKILWTFFKATSKFEHQRIVNAISSLFANSFPSKVQTKQKAQQQPQPEWRMLRLFQCISSSLSLFETAKCSPTLSLIRMTFLMALSFIFVFGSHLLLNFTLWCNTAAASKHCDISGDTTDMASFILKQLSLLHRKSFVSCLTKRSLRRHQHFTLRLASRRKLLLVPFPWIIPNKLCAFVSKSSPILFSYSLSRTQIHPRLRCNFQWQALLQQALPWHYQLNFQNVWLYIAFLPHGAEFVFLSEYLLEIFLFQRDDNESPSHFM